MQHVNAVENDEFVRGTATAQSDASAIWPLMLAQCKAVIRSTVTPLGGV